ncbi:hypothetical protein [Olivibacter sitiensis]|uniref:hypothetical protein n=1 Tax=Olivibacter sitiensis TaxID=376470 RepID=UPI001B7FB618|nr:hypothetical protein [Olivibacter sitiensis]
MLRKLLFKLTTAYVWIKHGHVPGIYRYFYRDTYYCKIHQAKYFFADYVRKKKYKVLEFNGEFAPELLFVAPFAYWHYLNGTLKQTRGCKYTSPLYYFSPDHQEIFEKRDPANNYNYEMPRILFSHDYNIRKWAPVPYAEHFANDLFRYEKPILVIANRYNMEWDGPPISFFSIERLDQIITLLKADYQIIYNRPRPNQITGDNSEIYDLEELDWLRQTHPDVILMEDLYRKHQESVSSFNHMQMLVYANTRHFISTHGGTAALACCFGGVNLIFSKRGEEHYFHCFETIYAKLSEVKIVVVKEDEELYPQIKKEFLP